MYQLYHAFRLPALAYLFACLALSVLELIEVLERHHARLAGNPQARHELRRELRMFLKIMMLAPLAPILVVVYFLKEMGMELLGFDRTCAAPTFEFIGNWVRGFKIDRRAC